MATVIGIVSKCDLIIEAHHKNQRKRVSCVVLYKLFTLSFKMVIITVSNKMKHFNYNVGCSTR